MARPYKAWQRTICCICMGFLFSFSLPRSASCQGSTSFGGDNGPATSVQAPYAPQPSMLKPKTIFALPSYLQTSGEQQDEPVIEWNKAIQFIIRGTNISNVAPRMFAFVHLAMWQSLRANNDTTQNPQPAPPVAVASYAAQSTLKTMVPLMFDKVNELYRYQTSSFSADELQLAAQIAEPVVVALLSSRIADGFQGVTPLAPASGDPGVFIDTGTPNILSSQGYANTTAFLLPQNLSMVDFVSNFTPPADVPSPPYSIQYTPTYLYGAANSTLRSASQTATAIFWADSSTQAYPSKTAGLISQWNRVFYGTLPSSLALEAQAELMAKLNVGLFDCIVSVYYLKYVFNYWRPLTAIRNGDPDHTPDPLWVPLLQTPNAPTYPSVSGCYAGLTSALLTNYHGRDQFTFSVATENLGVDGQILPNRIYQSFSQVATEVAQSRYFGGLEFPADSANALDFGVQISDYVVDNWAELDMMG